MNAGQNRSALTQGYQLHWYSIERVLGNGGFGITYLARDTNLNQQVAIKEYFPSDIAIRSDDLSVQPKTHGDADQYQWGLDRFRSEAQTLARFDHPNIVRIFTVFEANHTAYMIMRYERGEALNDILERRKRLPEEELLNVVLPILDGLGKVHETGFVHRDIQPANIYIREDKTPVLIDFGAAREAMGRPRTVTILVAPGYAPYEQYIANNQEQGPWTDIYGLGATLYRAIAGVAPIDAIERSRGILGSTRDVLVPASVVGQGRYSEPFLKAVDHALMFNEKDRPQTTAEWAQELKTGKTHTESVRLDNKPVVAESRGEKKQVSDQADDEISEIKAVIKESKAGPILRWAAPVMLFLVGIAVGVLYFKNGDLEQKNFPSTDSETGVAVTDDTGVAVTEKHRELDTGNISTGIAETLPANIKTPDSDSDPTRQLLQKISELEKRINANEITAQEIESVNDETTKQSVTIKKQIETDSEKLAAMEKELDTLEAKRLAEQQRLQQVIEERLKAQETVQKTPVKDKISQEPQMKVEKTSGMKSPAPLPLEIASVTADVEQLNAALKAFRERNFQKAFDLFRPLADEGNPEAQYYLADMYRNGLGILANNKAALNWIHKAAWQGYSEAQIALAKLYDEGVDGNRDTFLAYTWYLVAERNGINSHVTDRVAVEDQLQLEQLPQAVALATYLYKRQSAAGSSHENELSQ